MIAKQRPEPSRPLTEQVAKPVKSVVKPVTSRRMPPPKKKLFGYSEEDIYVTPDEGQYKGTRPREGLLDEIQEGAMNAQYINPLATFQPGMAQLLPPSVPQTRATVTRVPTGKSVAAVQNKPAPSHSYDISRPGQRVSVEEEIIDPAQIGLDIDRINNYTVVELKNFLRTLKLSIVGTKDVLANRLIDYFYPPE
jgi:hypothetical protein